MLYDTKLDTVIERMTQNLRCTGRCYFFHIMLIKITRTYLAVIFILKWDDDDDDYILKKSQGVRQQQIKSC
jgi:hypothetical protein